MDSKLILRSLPLVALVACGGSTPDSLIEKYRAEGGLVPVDESGGALRFTSRKKFEEFNEALSQMGLSQQRESSSIPIRQAMDTDDVQNITGTARFDGCRGELTRDTIVGLPANWKIYAARTVMETPYARGDGWGAQVAAFVALPISKPLAGTWVTAESLYNGSGYNTRTEDFGDPILVVDGTERKSKHQCKWGSYDSVCTLRVLGICLDHGREWHEDATREVEVGITP